VVPERIWKWGKSAKKNLSCASTLFGFTSTISRFGKRFRGGQYNHSLVILLFAVLLLTVPRFQPFVKWEARAPVPCGVGATVSYQDFVLGPHSPEPLETY